MGHSSTYLYLPRLQHITGIFKTNVQHSACRTAISNEAGIVLGELYFRREEGPVKSDRCSWIEGAVVGHKIREFNFNLCPLPYQLREYLLLNKDYQND